MTEKLTLVAVLALAAHAPLSHASTAHAQADAEVPPTPAPTRSTADEARDLFDRGFLALEAGHADEAVPLLRRSLELAPRPATAFNLALALRDLDAPIEAMSLAEGLLAGRYGTIDGGRRGEVERLRDELGAVLAALEVRIAGAERAALFVDDISVGALRAGTPHAAWLAPGEHTVRATVDETRSVDERVAFAAGERTRLLLHLGGLGNETTTEPVASGSSDALLWVGILGGVAIAAAAVITVLLVMANESGATVDPIYGRTETLLEF